MSQIRVALSGSGFRMPAHVGALQAIADAGHEIIELAGTSGGSIVAALHASGMDLTAMKALCLTYNWSRMMTFSAWSMLTGGYLCSGGAMLEFLTANTDGKTFADLPIDLKIVCADLLAEKKFVFSRATTPNAPIALAARASASIPIVFAPVSFQDILAVDGGTTDNIPASELTQDAVPRLGVYLESDDTPLKPGKYGLSTLAPRIIDLMLASNEDSHVALDSKNGAQIVRVPTGYASSFDRNMPLATRQRLFDDGYASTAAALGVRQAA